MLIVTGAKIWLDPQDLCRITDRISAAGQLNLLVGDLARNWLDLQSLDRITSPVFPAGRR